MEKFGRSQPVTRVEDIRFLTGHGRYVDDIAPADALHAAFLRAPVAHARITGLDLEEARAAEGVHAVYAADDLAALGLALEMGATLVTNRDGSKAAATERTVLARGRVRHVGEPVAVVVAETREQARDAAELIGFDYEDLPVHMEIGPGGEPLHDSAPDNRGYDWEIGDAAAAEAAFAAAARTVRLEVEDNRVIVNSMEPRGCFAEWQEGRLHLAFGGQGVWAMKAQLAKSFGLEPEQVRVTIPDVGGGFGMKVAPYPEYFVTAAAARALGRPVRWMSERTEAMLSDHAGRDLVSTAELAFDADNRITAYRVHSRSNLGAFNSNFGQAIQSSLFSKVLTGVYDIPTAYLRAEGFYTNTTQVDAYRGAGRPEAIYVLERLMDRAARELGEDPWELRRKNFIPADRFPYVTVVGETYDVGDFARVFARVEQEADRAGF
ncbi:MAG: xanthine dehydrogenase family protein molybdopterin-binding subunit, partial [Paracoccaceae bacterium]